MSWSKLLFTIGNLWLIVAVITPDRWSFEISYWTGVLCFFVSFMVAGIGQAIKNNKEHNI